MIQPLQLREMKSMISCFKVLQTDLSDGKNTWVFVVKQFKIHSNVFTLLFLKIYWNRGKAGRWSGLWDSGFALAEIRNPSAGAVPFPSTSQQQKDEGGEEEEGKGQEGKEEEEISPVYREVLGAVFDGSAVSQQEQGTTTTTTKKIAAAASKALHTLLLQLWDSARAALID